MEGKDKKVIKFNDFDFTANSTSEAMYKKDDNGDVVKQEYEFYSDAYPEKFRYSVSSNETEELYKDCDNVWILKQSDAIIATFSGSLDEDVIRQAIECLKTNEGDDEESNENI